jgi:hypothetical protein
VEVTDDDEAHAARTPFPSAPGARFEDG